MEKLDDKGVLKEALLGDKKIVKATDSAEAGIQRSAEEDKLRKAMGKD